LKAFLAMDEIACKKDFLRYLEGFKKEHRSALKHDYYYKVDMYLSRMRGSEFNNIPAGEAIQCRGRTDIRIVNPYAPDDIFIVECKFWRYPKKYLEYLEQLFSYLSPNEKHAALVTFCKQQRAEKAVLSARRRISQHPSFTSHNRLGR